MPGLRESHTQASLNNPQEERVGTALEALLSGILGLAGIFLNVLFVCVCVSNCADACRGCLSLWSWSDRC